MKIEVDIDEKGEFIGTVPAELDAILKKLEAAAHGAGFGKGSQKAAEEAKKQIEDAIKTERIKLEANMPVERAKWTEIDEQNKLLKSQLETTLQESRKALTSREEAHAVEITKRMEALKKRDAKITDLVNGQLRALAAQAGARDESLDELAIILRHRIGFDDDMEPYVKAEDGSPARTAAGNPLTMDVFVKTYLDNHPHHRKAAQGRGGDARRGASLSPAGGAPATVEAAKQRFESGDRSPSAINDIFEASRKKAS